MLNTPYRLALLHGASSHSPPTLPCHFQTTQTKRGFKIFYFSKGWG